MRGRIVEIKGFPVFFINKKKPDIAAFGDSIICYHVFESENAINGFPKEIINVEDEYFHNIKGAFFGTLLTNNLLPYDVNIAYSLDIDNPAPPCDIETVFEQDWVDTGYEMSLEEAVAEELQDNDEFNIEQKALFYEDEYPCVVRSISSPSGQHYCGYVGIPTTNPLYSFYRYGVLPVKCHGGITLDRYELEGVDIEGYRWIGFSYAQIGDKIRFPYGNIEPVKQECKLVVQQLKDFTAQLTK